MISLINKSAVICYLDTLKQEVQNVWPMVKSTRIPIYLDTSSAEFVPFRSLLMLMMASKDALPPTRVITLVQSAAQSYVSTLFADPQKTEVTLNQLIDHIPAKSLTIRQESSVSSIELDIPMTGKLLFLAELYLLAVTHFYYKRTYPDLSSPIRYDLRYLESSELSELQVNSQTPQFLGQPRTALCYETLTSNSPNTHQTLYHLAYLPILSRSEQRWRVI